MTKRQSWLILFLISLCIGSLCGCTRMRTIDKLGMVHVFGFDLGEDKQLIGTALYPNYKIGKDSDNIERLTEKAIAHNLLYQKLNKHSDTPIKLAKLRVIVLGKEYAESGITDMVERLLVTPEIGTRTQLAISEQSAAYTLKEFSKGGTLNLLDIIQHNMTRQYLPEMNLHFFLNHFYGQGMDAFVPMISLDERKKMVVNGIGVFKGDRLKLRLNEEQTLIFSAIKDTRLEGTLKMDVEHMGRKGIIIVRGYKNHNKWELESGTRNQPALNLTMKLDWTVTQYPSWIKLSNEKDKELLRKLITAEVKKDVEELLMTLKENHVDPIGIGNIVRSKSRKWDKKEFYEMYPNLPINVDVHLEMINAGLNV
ncbi:Ger(x)C family spore germination protein [Neobacillus sp. OS1-2]|uniref:Ger(x)C family spore germination protein n=1 Tax=Neobacillus sp. OS1-2 TaxID=3070680 RepID=UPI0027E0FB21|nr:Ger(x)C family spore germination protein [Neobacillus sp. OS1-2]WML41784.1 Ger(x)C family spore germination protein [Neobacillus sp. OS1-2]